MSLNRISTINVHEAQPNVEEESRKRGNRALGSNASYWNLLHIFTILAFSALVLSPQLLIPRHNSIYYPNYWHEIIIVIVVATFCLSMRTLMEFIVFTKEKSLLKIGVLLKIAACFIIPMLFVVYSLDIFWTLIMGFEHPMPLQGMLGYFVALSVPDRTKNHRVHGSKRWIDFWSFVSGSQFIIDSYCLQLFYKCFNWCISFYIGH